MSRGRDTDEREGRIRGHGPARRGADRQPETLGSQAHGLSRDRKKDGADQTSALSDSRGGGSGSEQERRETERFFGTNGIAKPVPGRRRERWGDARRNYQLRDSEIQTLEEIGKFRTLREDDLARYRYRGDTARMQQDLRSLTDQRLVQRRHLTPRGSGRMSVVVLTRQGKRFLEKGNGIEDRRRQQVHAGFVKPAEVVHDAAIYRMYQAEADKIRRGGGQVRRVVLDYELKREVFSPLAKAKDLPAEQFSKRQEEVAAANHLKVIEGKIPLPDLRIEYETRDGEVARVDLELATEHYKAAQLAEKARAGFKLYAPGSASSGGSAVQEEREITADILSL